ncbi:MAG TPA: hypothetical protein VGG64_17895 [Pirellulales bacterium]|jgi:hypothetical protein
MMTLLSEDTPASLADAMVAFLVSEGLDPITTRLIKPGLEFQFWLDDRPRRIPIGRNSGEPVFGGELVTVNQLRKRLGLVGVTGWHWQTKQTLFIILDFDAKDHAAGHLEEVLARVIDAARRLGWCWVRRSKGGRGFHVVVSLSRPLPAESGTEHQHNAATIVDRMCEEAAFNFRDCLDCAGVVGYVWAPKVAPNAFEIIVEPTCLTPEIDAGLIATGQQNKGKRQSASSDPPAAELNEQHLADIRKMREAGFIADYSDGRLLCHSKGFEALYAEHGRPGKYRSRSAGRYPTKPNAFAFPVDDGGWTVSRFNITPSAECECWYANAQGFATARIRPPIDFLISSLKYSNE